MKRKFKAFIPIVLICTMLMGNFCYASSVDDTLSSVFDSVADALSGWLATEYGIVIPSSAFYARALSTYDITFPDAEEDFDDYVEDNTSIDDGNLVVNVDLSNFLVDVANKYIDENPMSYSVQKIASYRNASSTYFKTLAQFEAYKGFIESLEGVDYFFMPQYNSIDCSNFYYNYGGGEVNNNGKVIIYQSDYSLDFYSNGHLKDFVDTNKIYPTHNWSDIRPSNSSSNVTYFGNGFRVCVIRQDGTVVDNPTHYWFRTSNVAMWTNWRNSRLTQNVGGLAVFNTSPSDLNTYVFDSISALKIFNSGQPSPYYVTENYKGSDYVYTSNSVNSVSSVYNNAQTYTEITQNITSGISADELNTIIQTIINTNNDKPLPPSDGGGGSGSDDKESLWDKIKDKLGDFFGAIADVITGIVELIVGTVITALTELIKGFRDILSTMKDFFIGNEDTEGFFSLMSGFFDWLPEPLPLMIKSIFTLACVFALIRMIKGLAS